MKEAAGEANMTVITIVLIAIVLGVGTLIIDSVLSTTGRSTACTTAGAQWKNGHCCKDEACNSKLTCSKATQDNDAEGRKKGEWYCS